MDVSSPPKRFVDWSHLTPVLVHGASILLVFPLAGAPPDQSTLLVLVWKFPPERHLVSLTRAVRHRGRRFARDHGGRVVSRRGQREAVHRAHRLLPHWAGGCGRGQEAGGAGREEAGRSVRHEAAAPPTPPPPWPRPVRKEPVAACAHSLSLFLMHLQSQNEGQEVC